MEIYREIADLEERRGSAQTRDRFLILAADAALQAGYEDEADALRERLLESNPHHLLRPYPSFAGAMHSADVASYVADLRGCYPPEEAARLLDSLRNGGPGPTAEAPGAHGSTLPFPPGSAAGEHAPADLDFLPREKPVESGRRNPPSVSDFDVDAAAVAPTPIPFQPPEEPRTKRPPTTLPPTTLLPPPMPAAEPSVPRPAKPALRRSKPAGEPPSAVNSWVASTLFVLLLIVGVALAGYTIARPYLPAPETYLGKG
jgi:hypothetical protein